jgi:hypothetical protein
MSNFAYNLINESNDLLSNDLSSNDLSSNDTYLFFYIMLICISCAIGCFSYFMWYIIFDGNLWLSIILSFVTCVIPILASINVPYKYKRLK